ncbi:MAG TPA: hypothetical protein DF383_13275 [Deltaproteobacteria bacterium]|nr:hypothetical protein [Deltaproteobacteria bacterium]
MLNNISLNIRRLRDQAGFTQFDLAVKAKMSLSHVNRIECGVAKNPRFETLRRIAKAFKIAPEELLLAAPQPKRAETKAAEATNAL